MALIPERLWQMMTDEEKTLVQDVVDGFKQAPRIVCPNCQHEVAVRLKVTLGALEPGRLTPSKPADPEPVQPEDAAQKEILAHAIETGMLGAFQRAFEKATKTKLSSDHAIQRAFLTFVDQAHSRTVPMFVLDRYKSIYKGYVEFLQFNGVVVVVSEHIWREFIPVPLLVGAALKNQSGHTKGRLAVDETKFHEWIKGKYGYVPNASGAFKDLLTRKSFGAFDELTQ